MPKRQQLDLSTFDDRLLDGLDFCGKVYDLFDHVKDGIDGVANLRLRATKTAKRLIEELIPIARYVQARYREGRRIKVRWSSGSQSYDAILWSSGDLVRHRLAPRRLLVEVTTSIHQNEYLVRQQVHEQGVSFGAKSIWRDKKTRHIVSEPYVYTNDERGADLVSQILDRLKRKCAKRYPRGTVLIINCVANGLMIDSEWNHAIELVSTAQLHSAFREVFLVEPIRGYSATLYGH